MFRVVERSILFFWDFNHYSTCGIGKRINSFVLGIEQSLSFFHLYLVEECSQFCMLWYWYQHTFVLSLSMFTIEALVFFFRLGILCDSRLSILFYFQYAWLHSAYIYIFSSLSARMEEFYFLWLFIFRTSKLRNDVYACFIYCGRSSLFSTRYGFDLTYTSYLVMVRDCS